MASSGEKCNFCVGVMIEPQKGWRLKDSTYAKLCVLCFTAFSDGTFCDQYHEDESGWRKCDECEKEVHCGCVMSLHLYEANDLCGVTCKVCIEKKSLVSDIGTSNASSSPEDSYQSDDSSSFPENVTGESEPPNVENQNTDTATTEGDLDQSQLPNPGLIFLFEKHLIPADCDAKSGRLLLTKLQGEKLLDQTPENRTIYVDVEDIVGNQWKLKLRWWSTNNSRRYIFDGTRKCCQKMQWNAGDTCGISPTASDQVSVYFSSHSELTSSKVGLKDTCRADFRWEIDLGASKDSNKYFSKYPIGTAAPELQDRKAAV